MRGPRPFTIGLVIGGVGAERAADRRTASDVTRTLAPYGLDMRTFDLHGPIDHRMLAGTDTLFVINTSCGSSERRDRFFQAAARLSIGRIGQDAAAVRLARDKHATNALLTSVGIRTPRGIAIAHEMTEAEVAEVVRSAVARFGLPLIVKDRFGSSSEHVYAPRDEAEAARATRTILRACGDALIEEYVPGTEVTVPCVTLAGRTLPLAPVEISYDGPIYDFATKNRTLRNKLHVPPRLPASAIAACRNAARTAFDALGCRHLARVDLRMDGARQVVLEVNGEPVLGKNDFLARSAKHLGFTYARFITALLLNDETFRTHAERRGDALTKYVATTDAMVARLADADQASISMAKEGVVRTVTPSLARTAALSGRR
jgi:D-alanine-D-alanine ligase